jgi:hypothetical protein
VKQNDKVRTSRNATCPCKLLLVVEQNMVVEHRIYGSYLRLVSFCCCLQFSLAYPHRGNSARSALAEQGMAAVAAARFALLCQCPPPTATAIARPRSGLYCKLSTDLLLFAFVHAGCAHVFLDSRTSQRLTNAYLTPVHLQSLLCPLPVPPTPVPPTSLDLQSRPPRH